MSPDNLRVTELPASYANLINIYNGLGASYWQMYRGQQNVRSAIGVIAREAAGLHLKMYEKVPRAKDLASERVELNDHDIMILLDEPTPGDSPYRFWYATFSDIALFDIAFWKKIKQNGVPAALMRIPPDNLIANPDSYTGQITSWRSTITGEIIRTDDLVIFWGYDPRVNHGSISPMETLRRVLAEQYSADYNREGMWKNALRMEGVIEVDKDAPRMAEDAREDYLLDAEAALSGADNSGRPFMMEPGHSFKEHTWDPRTMEYLNVRRLNRVEVAAAFFMAPSMIACAQSGAEPTRETLNFFYMSSLPPWLQRVEQEIKAQLLPDFVPSAKIRRNQYFEFNLDSKLRGSFEEAAQILLATAGGPIVTVNEARARINLPPLEDGDAIFIPLNLMRAGGPQTEPGSPTETPAPAAGNLETINATPGGGGGTAPPPSGAASYYGNATNTLMNVAVGPDGQLVVAKPVREKSNGHLVLDDDLLIARALSPEAKSADEVITAHEAKVQKRADARAQMEFLREARVRAEGRYKEVLDKFFSRQLNAHKGRKSLKERKDRWDRELEDDIFGVHYQTVSAVGPHVAKHLGSDFDRERTAEYLRERAKYTARFVNDATVDRIGSEQDLETVFGEGRQHSLALSLAAFSVGWSVTEAAHQSGEKATKTWSTTSEKPRETHAAQDGMTVGYHEKFPNGLAYPGDPEGDVDEVAGCTCLISVTQ
jgi:HK97 family phage portal protein